MRSGAKKAGGSSEAMYTRLCGGSQSASELPICAGRVISSICAHCAGVNEPRLHDVLNWSVRRT